MSEEKNNNGIRKNSGSSTPISRNIENIKKNNLFLKEVNLNLKKAHSNQVLEGGCGEESRSRSTFGQKNKIKKSIPKKSDSYKSRKKEKEKISKILKNERLKIPKGKRMSIANNSIKLNLNNIEKIIKTLPKQKSKTFERMDSFGNIINKENKKNVHIMFLDKKPSHRLIEIVPIESFKQFNVMEKNPDDTNISLTSKCCQIF